MKVAIIGAGRMGRTHIRVARQSGLNLVGICDPRQESLELARTEEGIGAELHFNDPKLLLQETQPECLIIATTAPAHCEITCMAAESGVGYILCEKPMAVSLEQCDRMIATCEAHNTRLAINHQMRFMEKCTKIKKLVNEEDFGGLSSITIVAGNFGLAMNATHYFELFRYMTDEPPSQVSAWFSQERVVNPRGVEFEDRAGSIRVSTPSGKRLYIEAGADQGHSIRVLYAGRYGQLVVNELGGVLHKAVRQEQDRELPSTRYSTPSIETEETIQPTSLVGPTCAVLEALFQGRDYPSGQDGRQAVSVLVGAYVSDENNHTSVDLNHAVLPRNRNFPWA